GLIALPYPLDGLVAEPLLDDPLVLACRKDHPLARKLEIGLGDLRPEELLLLEDGHCLRSHALAACSLAERRRGEDIVGTSVATLVQMVAGGIGVTLLPTVALERELSASEDLTMVPLARDAPSRRVALVCRAGYPGIDGFHALAEVMRQALGRG
ncbi:MAG TPA: LysR substrate-binding domain-containing protein, partial [Thalassobaculum sp.]